MRLVLLLPYLAVLVGLVWLRSAWIAIVLYHLTILTTLMCGTRRSLRIVGRFPPGISILAVAATISSGLIIVVLHPLLASDSWSATLHEFGLSGGAWLWFLPYFAVVHPPLEELFWRGYVQKSEGLLALEDLAFAGYHALFLPFFLDTIWVALSVSVLAVVSAVWRKMKLRYSGLLLPILTHIAADTSIILAVHLIIR